jgi:hypothetical protein
MSSPYFGRGSRGASLDRSGGLVEESPVVLLGRALAGGPRDATTGSSAVSHQRGRARTGTAPVTLASFSCT